MEKFINTTPNNRIKTPLIAILTVAVIWGVGLISIGVYNLVKEETSVTDYPNVSVKETDNSDVSGTSTTTCNISNIDVNDIYSSFAGEKTWVLLGSEFTDREQSLKLSLNINKKYDESIVPTDDWKISYIVGGDSSEGDFRKIDNFEYVALIDAKNITPGTYQVKALIDFGCGKVTTDSHEFKVSYPVYVNWTQDWEGTEIPDQYLADMEKIANDHSIPMTHFFNPRIYVTDAVSDARAEYFTNWVLRRESDYGDDIGLHLHMFPDMIAAAGVTPLEDPVAWGQGRDDGYDILVSNYSEKDMIKILNWSKQVFIEKGLGDPTMFRAGGWYADEETLAAVEATGFVLDSSGRTEYALGNNAPAGHWDLSTITAPYLLNTSDQNITDNPNTNLWEFPNNGNDSWSFSKEELIRRFTANFDGNPTNEKKVINYLSHPHWFATDKPKMEGLFIEIDKNLYASDNGPVIYTTLSETYRIWTLPNDN